MKRSVIDGGSMDMLLDTMCNTFGGVCFIALMVVLISSAMPKSKDEQSELDRVRQAEITTREVARLVQRRDMLKTALDLETEFVNANATGIVTRADMEKMLADVATSGDKIAAYEKKRVEYLDELAKLKTKDQYSKREAARLERLLADLREKVGNPLLGRHRVVRAPREREIMGMRIINVWMHQRRLYMMDDPDNIRISNHRKIGNDETWEVHLVRGKGLLVDDDFFMYGKVWQELKKRFGPNTYVRIFVDTASFDELCLFRDALISHKSLYNWIVVEEDSISFRNGYDGIVQ
jgi:hypothetical protein